MSSSRENLKTCQIPLNEIIRATNDFSSETQIGDGGFGMVYRGQLSEQRENRLVAIKRLNRNGFQGNTEFYNELEMVKIFNHPNIIPFIGYCDEANEKIVVYEYATNKSLDRYLQNPNKRRYLTWTQRLKICLGAARGLKYLHSGVGEHRRVIHRDVKSANILLDDNLEAKICDFGLSRFSPRNQPDTRVCTRASGTTFYIDPIYSERGRLTKESDIYSFGVVMFEMSSGTLAYDQKHFEEANEQYLIGVVRSTYEEHDGRITGLDMLMDPDIRGRMYVSSLHIFHEIAYECIDLNIKKRPTMDRIIEGIEEALDIQSFYINKTIEWKYYSDKNIYMCGAKDLTIEWQHDTRYWKWEHRPESRFPEVSILSHVYWLEIQGRIAVAKLSQKNTYVAYLVFQTIKNSTGLDEPAKTRISIGGIEIKTENVYLTRPQCVQEYYVLPQRRKDGWLEIKLGEFESKEGDDGEVEMAFNQLEAIRKSGLVVEGFEIRTK